MSEYESARLQTRFGEMMMLKGVRVNGVLRGALYDASVEQRFCNPTDKHVEVVYSFPLPWGAVLLGVDVKLGERQLSGAVIEKKEAEIQYEGALADGNAAIMLEKNADRSYSLNLGNLAAREDCIITLRYAQSLQFEQHGLRLLIPTVIAPRYGDPVIDGGLQPHQASEHSFYVAYPFDIELQLHGDLARARVGSPSHPVSMITQAAQDGPVLIVSLARRGALDRDFVLVVDQLQHGSLAVADRDLVHPDHVAVLASFCPRIRAQAVANVAVKILVDCSGSMQGSSIDAARRSLQSIVDQLVENDHFSLSRFGSTVMHRSRGLWRVTEPTRQGARRWINDLQADLGGTEMEAAFKSTFALAKESASDVLVLTDGEIYAIDSTIEAARASGHRLFIVGIGSSSAETHLWRLAEATGGACDFVAPGEAVEPAVIRMFARLRSPRLSGLTLSWPDGSKPEWTSPLNPAVFDGDTVNLYALLPRLPEGALRLYGTRFDNGMQEEIGSVNFNLMPQSGDALSRVAASLRLQSMPDEAAAPEAVSLAVAYGLVTDRTNFLLVHERAQADKPNDMPELHKVVQMTPAGWGGFGEVAMDMLHAAAPACAPPSFAAAAPAPVGARTGAMPPPKKSSSALDRQRSALVRSKERRSIPDRDNPQYWSQTDDYTGLTPLGLSEWLANTRKEEWPATYDGLRQIGLGTSLIDWLELAISTRNGVSLDEQTVIGAFLYLMSQRATHDSLAASDGLRQGLASVVKQLIGLFIASNPDVVESPADSTQQELAKTILAALDGMTAVRWPDQVFSLSIHEMVAAEIIC